MILFKNALIILISFFLSLSPPGLWAAAALMNLEVGEQVPSFEMRTIDGKEISSDKMKGRILILAFWKTGQAESKENLADLEQLYRKYRDRGVLVLAINADNAPESEIIRTKTAQSLSYLLASDKDLTVYGRFGVVVLPSTLVIGPDGKLVYYHPIRRGDFYQQVEGRLRVMLGDITTARLEAELKPQKISGSSAERKKAERYVNMGRALMDMGLKENARENLITAAETDPSFSEAHILLAKIYLQEKDVEHAGKALGQALKQVSGAKGEKLRQGISHADRGEDSLALSFFMQVIEEDPSPPPEAYYHMGRIYEKQNKTSQALASYRAALERLPAK